MATQIATAAEEQTAVTEEINRNTNAINEVSSLFLIEAEKGLDEASELQDQSKKMGTLVGHFKLN
jgi:methyl-accepting chemotaxis protein